ncbi:MAG: hypothetical protein QM533_13320, partial [Cytophagales bacterium]|nr:hypothetical protein [Cytophagales bacterium]
DNSVFHLFFGVHTLGTGSLIGYKRNTFSGLTLLTFGTFGGLIVNKNWDATFSLQVNLSNEMKIWPESDLVTLNSFQLPNAFIKLIVQASEQKREQDQAFYRSLFPPPLGNNPNAKPFNIK